MRHRAGEVGTRGEEVRRAEGREYDGASSRGIYLPPPADPPLLPPHPRRPHRPLRPAQLRLREERALPRRQRGGRPRRGGEPAQSGQGGRQRGEGQGPTPPRNISKSRAASTAQPFRVSSRSREHTGHESGGETARNSGVRRALLYRGPSPASTRLSLALPPARRPTGLGRPRGGCLRIGAGAWN